MAKQPTIKEVAKLAGVSVATASRALNDPTYPVSAETNQKVREAAEKLAYVPNMVARSLRKEAYHDIGLVIPNVSNPFYLQAMLGINDVLMSNHYNLLLCNTMRSVEQERECLRQLYERQTKGVILSSVDENSDLIREYSGRGMKFVLLDQKLTGVDCPGINFDSRVGARMAVDYLVSQGHRKIALGTTPMTKWTRIEMHQGYQEGLMAAGISYDPKRIYEVKEEDLDGNGDMELQAGREIARKILQDGAGITALLCVNDMVAFGAIREFCRNGIRVPEDLSVIGFDDIPFAEAFMPALTTIHYPAQETGRLAALLMMDLLKNASKGLSMSMNLNPRLVVRDTVAPPRDQSNE